MICRFVFASFLVPFWCRFGLPNEPLGVREKSANRPLGGSRSVLGSSWFGPFFVLPFGFAFLTFLGSSWGGFGPLLAPFWASSALLGTILAHSWGHFRPPRGRCSIRGCRCATLLESMFAFHFSMLTFGFSMFNLLRLDLGPALRTARCAIK